MEIDLVLSYLAIGSESHRCTLKLRWRKVVLASAASAFETTAHWDLDRWVDTIAEKEGRTWARR
jgi:hypothetical protein